MAVAAMIKHGRCRSGRACSRGLRTATSSLDLRGQMVSTEPAGVSDEVLRGELAPRGSLRDIPWTRLRSSR
eukprot:9435521-Pyramimonas_sp.AAC.1